MSECLNALLAPIDAMLSISDALIAPKSDVMLQSGRAGGDEIVTLRIVPPFYRALVGGNGASKLAASRSSRSRWNPVWILKRVGANGPDGVQNVLIASRPVLTEGYSFNLNHSYPTLGSSVSI
jgi:hypothetical protein